MRTWFVWMCECLVSVLHGEHTSGRRVFAYGVCVCVCVRVCARHSLAEWCPQAALADHSKVTRIASEAKTFERHFFALDALGRLQRAIMAAYLLQQRTKTQQRSRAYGNALRIACATCRMRWETKARHVFRYSKGTGWVPKGVIEGYSLLTRGHSTNTTDSRVLVRPPGGGAHAHACVGSC